MVYCLISIISELNKEFPPIWLVERFSIWRYIIKTFSRPGYWARHLCHLGDNSWRHGRLFGRHHCKSRILERMENFQNECCRPWKKKAFKNSCSRQLRIVNAVASWSPAGQIDWPKSVFLQDKVTLFETVMTTMNDVNRDKTKVPD